MSGEKERDEGMERARRKHQEWQRKFNAVAAGFIRSGRYFTVEDITDITGLPSGSIGGNKVIGAAMSAVVRQGKVTKVGYTKTRRKTSHARELAVWARKTERTAKKCPTCGEVT